MSHLNSRGWIGFTVSAVTIALISASAPAVWAHPGHAPGAGLLDGWLHPFLGWDHLAILFGAGWFAARRGGREWLAAPARFAMLMGVGTALGLSGLTLPGMGAATVLALAGLVLLSFVRPRGMETASSLLLAVMAFAHGQLHASAWEGHGHPLAFALGLAAASGIAAALLALALRRVAALGHTVTAR
jgi:urease accessory protein